MKISCIHNETRKEQQQKSSRVRYHATIESEKSSKNNKICVFSTRREREGKRKTSAQKENERKRENKRFQ